MKFKNPEGQLARWLEVLSTYDMLIEHRPGAQHQNADALSRIPCKQCGFFSSWDQEDMPGSVNTITKSAEETKLPDDISLKSIQEKDADIALVIKWLKGGIKPKSEDLAGKSIFVREIVGQWDMLLIRDDLLYRKWVTGQGNDIFQAVIPARERRKVLYFCHDFKGSGHLGHKKTLEKVRSKYYWPGCRKDVRTYVAGCETCSKRKSPNVTKRAPMKVVETGIPMERVATDILGELPKTDRGNRYILVVSDYFTKWTDSFAMPNMEAQTVAKILVEEVFAKLGVPRILHSDQGRQYESNLFQELCALLHIEKTRTSPYHPQSDGMVERFNKTLATMLSAYVNDHQTNWDESLPYVMQAYRSAVHETTGYTPNFLMLGRETTTPLDLMYELPGDLKITPRNQWVWELQERLEEAHSIVRENTKQAMCRQKTYHDRKLSFEKFSPGDIVFVYFPVKKVGRSAKLTSFWRGPYKILGKCSELNYRVDCGQRGKEQVVHVDRIRLRHPQLLRGESSQLDELVERESPNDIVELKEPDVVDDFDSENNQIGDQVSESTLGQQCPNDERLLGPSKRERRPPKWMSDYIRD